MIILNISKIPPAPLKRGITPCGFKKLYIMLICFNINKLANMALLNIFKIPPAPLKRGITPCGFKRLYFFYVGLKFTHLFSYKII